MRTLLLLALFGVFLLVLWLVADAFDNDAEDTPVRAWGTPQPAYVIEPPSTTSTTRPPSKRPIIHATQAGRAVVVGHDEVVAVIRDVFSRFGPDVAEQAVRVSGCETGGTYNPAVVNSSGHTGLFQLSPRYHTARAARLGFTWEQMREARPNALVAADLFAEQGWGPWTCRRAA